MEKADLECYEANEPKKKEENYEVLLKLAECTRLNEIERTLVSQIKDMEAEMIGLFKILREIRAQIKKTRYLEVVKRTND